MFCTCVGNNIYINMEINIQNILINSDFGHSVVNAVLILICGTTEEVYFRP